MGKEIAAIELFRNKFNCSQAVLTVFGTEYGLKEDDCLKIACAFGGGMGRCQMTCGAVTGALMALGLKHGKALSDPEEKKLHTYSVAVEFMNRFRNLNGSVNCRELLDGLDLNDPDDHKRIVDQKFFELKCEKYVSDAVRITSELM